MTNADPPVPAPAAPGGPRPVAPEDGFAVLDEGAVLAARSPFPTVRLVAAELPALSWARQGEGRRLLAFLLGRAAGFPTIPLAYAAEAGLSGMARELARQLNHLGVNAFLPASGPVPLAALSATVVERRLPLGLYLTAADAGAAGLLVLDSDGGCLDELAVPSVGSGDVPDAFEREAVCGEIDMLGAYAHNLVGLLDPSPERAGPGLAALACPFPGLLELVRAQGGRAAIFTADRPGGLRAELSGDGQRLRVAGAGTTPTGATLATALVRYLVGERGAGGRVLGPELLPALPDVAQEAVADAGWLRLAHRVGRCDLLLAWGHDGWLAHQGQGPFGDGLLSLAYLLEAGFRP